MNKREKPKLDKQMAKKFCKMAKEMVKCSGDRLRLAYQERDDSKDSKIGISHFLKLDEKRLGKDIEIYIFQGCRPPGWHYALNAFAGEIIGPLYQILPESYKKGCEAANNLREYIALKGAR